MVLFPRRNELPAPVGRELGLARRCRCAGKLHSCAEPDYKPPSWPIMSTLQLGILAIERNHKYHTAPANTSSLYCSSIRRLHYSRSLLHFHGHSSLSRMSSTTDIDAIRATLLAYGDALNTASVDKCVTQYTTDGICMPQHQRSSQGTENLKKTYEGFFDVLKFDVKFDIKEVSVVAPEWAFARTESAGTTVMGGREQNEANQELFLMKKVGGGWKIARYCFCTMNPPK